MSKLNKVVGSSIFWVLLTGYAYAISTAKYHGYLSLMKLDTDVMARDFHQIVYNGFVLNFGWLFGFLLMYYLFSPLYMFVFYPLMVRYSFKRKQVYIRKGLRWFWSANRKEYPLIINKVSANSINLLFSIIALVFVISILKFEKEGKESAREMMCYYYAAPEARKNLKVVINNQPKELATLGCGAKVCAGIHWDTQEVEYFPNVTGVYHRADIFDILGKLHTSNNDTSRKKRQEIADKYELCIKKSVEEN
ncbi:hypothetical protein [Pleionea sp. CnH1-48]|uniref:hypothetical protein n=1 Tax=Pleionea sp. CnH1-48 TaxID=2954494 RepID=UPI0020971BB6|nr:hypothetical protein [Pleionea sp. CnH1-48]MCO7225937.1 hypothetical protein [Pleionea sp. CnH1-48]